MEDLAFLLRRLFLGDESERARAWQLRAEEALDDRERDELRRFAARLRREPGRDRLMLGRARDAQGLPFWCGMRIAEFLGQHGWLTGSTGGGKSFLAAIWLMQVIRRGRNPVLLVDLKSELSDLLLEVVLPAIASSGNAEELARRVRVVRPFSDHLPRLRVTEPEDGVPRGVQAHNLASALSESVGDDLGSRMARVFLRLAALAIELRLPLTVVQRWLASPHVFARDARRSADPTLREYALGGFARESRPAIDALLARLDSFAFLDEVRLALAAPTCVSFTECLRGGVTVVDLGAVPGGAERVQRFWAGILIGRIARAALSRPITARTPPAWLLVEEAQEGLTRDSAQQFARLLALARHKRVAITLINQQPAQLASVDPTLVKVLRTNCGYEAAFRANYEDAKTLVDPMPIPVGTPKAGEVRQALAQGLTRLAQREYLLWLKQADFAARVIRSPRLDLDALRRAADRVPADVREAIRRGTVSIPRVELERLVQEDARCDANPRDEQPTPEVMLGRRRRHPRLG